MHLGSRARDKSRGGADGEASTRPIGEHGDEQERYILSALEDLKDMEVREVMTPRADVVSLAIPVDSPTVARAVKQTGFLRFPVYDGDLDNLIGVLYVNDLFRAGWEVGGGGDAEVGNGARSRPSPLEISRRIRQPYLVPESRRVLDVLAEMRRDRHAFAVVVDEYGGVAGVLAIKDLLGALVGDLRDEFDPAGEPEIVRVDSTRWLVDGGLSIDEARDRLVPGLPEGEYVTIAGFVLDSLDRIPEEGDELHYGDWLLKVHEMERRRIAKLLLVRSRGERANGDAGEPDLPAAGK